jgi:membrane protease YdiL (CAAX protease family)
VGGRTKRGIELALLFGAGPLGLALARHEIRLILFPLLWLAAGLCAAILWRDPGFERACLGRVSAIRGAARRILTEVALGGALLGLALLALDPERLFALPRERTGLWLAILFAYPVASAWPQEIVFRAYFFRRYAALFRSERALCLASALAFGWAHAFLGTWIAVALSTAGGFLFARTFARTRSTLAAAAEHALWGDVLFTLGWGWYLWAGSIGVSGP